MQIYRGIQARLTSVLAMIVVCITYAVLSSGTALSAPVTQGDPQAIRLGELISADMAMDETVIYELTLPLDGNYLFTTDDEQEASAFDLVIRDEAGDVTSEGVFVPRDLALAAGTYTVEFTAGDDARLSFVTLGQIGEMSEDPDAPGQLYNGGFYVLQGVDGDRYAQLTIDDSPHLQQVAILIQISEGSSAFVTVESDEVYESTDTDVENSLTFWSTGGDYSVSLEPFGTAAEIMLTTLLSGPPPVLPSGEAVAGELADLEDTKTYRFEVPETGSLMSVNLQSDVPESDFELDVGLLPDSDNWSSYRLGSDEEIRFMAPTAGTYYARVSSSGGSGEFEILAQEQGMAQRLTANDVAWGKSVDGSDQVYALAIDEPDKLLSIILVGDPTVDLDLRAVLLDRLGETVHYLSSLENGSTEVVSQANAQPGLYEVTVSSPFGDAGNYFLLIRLEDPAELGGQWAIEAEATSQYGDREWSAQQATGAPDSVNGTDDENAWAPEGTEAGLQTLTLVYKHPVYPTGVDIYESLGPGAVVAVEAYDVDGDDWVALWKGTADTAHRGEAIFSPDLAPAGFATDTIRLLLDTDSVPGYNEIDAVRLFGRP